ncbi:hypothetical protein [Aliiroseovarius sp. PrR006]|uniref:hypothetical protein n=1 Tax=Aliiroseovarius sp. PrR006 TaxID=2706883 RepID=UPI0013D661C6|nr:hypothetical protein [Aliiroseovarius sp. PrR006]NDW54001.1 hypothetical protein [Aliiroseovarius sp. PrR006]
MRGNRGAIGKWGLIGTILYIAVLLVIVWHNWSKFSSLEPNAWGDFLAGTFGPLALGWVVLGFFLQSKELQNSVDALKLQARELAHSAEQQKEMVNVTRETLMHEREVLELQAQSRKISIQPVFQIVFGVDVITGDELRRYKISAFNTGADATHFSIDVYVDGGLFLNTERRYFRKGDSCIVAHQKLQRTIEGTLSAIVKYTDADQETFEKHYTISPNDENGSEYIVSCNLTRPA